jgi:CBS domain-containing protein
VLWERGGLVKKFKAVRFDSPDGEMPVGIVTERDFVRRVVAKRRPLDTHNYWSRCPRCCV